MRIQSRTVIAAFFFATLFLSSGAMEAFLLGGTTGFADPSGSPLMKILWAGIYLITLGLLVPHRKQVMELLRENKAFVCLNLITIASIYWSIDAHVTLAKSLPLILSALVGLEFARRYSIEEQLRIIWRVLALVMVMGVIAQVFFPGFVPQPGDDLIAATAWHGIVTSKNTWARLVVLTGIVILSRPRRTRVDSVRVLILIILVFALTVASKSSGGIAVMIAITLLFPIFGILRWQRRRSLVVLLYSVIATVLISLPLLLPNLSGFLTGIGKDPTMTGRIPIWTAAMRYVHERPVLGYGYMAFWSQDSRPGRLIREAIGWDTLPHAHNGYIDLALSLGLLGLALYVLTNAVAFWRAGQLIRKELDQTALWPMALLCVVFIYQLDESSIVAGNQLVWILFSAVIFSLPRKLASLEAQATAQTEAELHVFAS